MARGLASSACKRGLQAVKRGRNFEEPQAAQEVKRTASLGPCSTRAAQARLPGRSAPGWAAVGASQDIPVHGTPGAWRGYRAASVLKGGDITWKAWREKLLGQLTEWSNGLLQPAASVELPEAAAALAFQHILPQPLETGPAPACAAVEVLTAEEIGRLTFAELAGRAVLLEAAPLPAPHLLLEPLCTALCARLTAGPPNWDGQAVASLLKACVASVYTPPVAQLGALAQAAAGNIQIIESSPLAHILSSLAHWQFRHEALLKAVAEEMLLTPMRFPSEALINMAYSLCRLERCSLRLMDCVMQRVMPDLEKLPVRSLSSKSLVDAVSALQLLQPPSSDHMVSVFMRRLSDQLRPQHCSAPQLADILYCCYSVNFQGLRRGTVLESAFRRILECHQELKPEHMVRLAQCLEMHIENVPSEGLRLLDALAQHAARHIEDFSPAQLAALLCAHSAVRHCDEALLGAASQRVLAAHRPESIPTTLFSTAQLVDTLWASASLGRRPEGELVELVLSAVLAAPQVLSGECLSRALWSLGVMERLRNEDYDVLALCLARTQLTEFGPQALQQLYMVELMLGAAAFRSGGAAGPPRQLPDNLRRLSAEAWQDRLYQNATSSRFQQHICRTLNDLGHPYSFERFVDHGLGIDIVLTGPGLEKVAIEADGGRRFTRNAPYQMLGDIAAIQRMLATHGWHVISIPKHEWNLHGADSRGRMNLLQSRIAGVTS